jgi:phage FluMu protein Com
MQLRCMYCRNMFAVSRDEMLVALQHMQAENLQHYDAHCPRCRRANRIERKRLEIANPGWQEQIKEMGAESAQAEKKATKAATPAPAKKEPAKKSPAKESPAKKSPAKKAPAKSSKK